MDQKNEQNLFIHLAIAFIYFQKKIPNSPINSIQRRHKRRTNTIFRQTMAKHEYDSRWLCMNQAARSHSVRYLLRRQFPSAHEGDKMTQKKQK